MRQTIVNRFVAGSLRPAERACADNWLTRAALRGTAGLGVRLHLGKKGWWSLAAAVPRSSADRSSNRRIGEPCDQSAY